MARFNTPPGWPAFPDGWMPTEGWQPDPRWPRPPADWQWWLAEPPRRRTPRGAGFPPRTSQVVSPSVVAPSPRMSRVAPRPGWGTPDAVDSAVVRPAPRPGRRWSARLTAAMSTPAGVVGILLAGAALVIVVGSMLPWIGRRSRAVGGVDGDGVITLTFGALLAIGGAAIVLKRWRAAPIVSFALALGCAAVAVIDITSVASALALGAVGPGLWITAVGAAAALAAAAAGRRIGPH